MEEIHKRCQDTERGRCKQRLPPFAIQAATEATENYCEQIFVLMQTEGPSSEILVCSGTEESVSSSGKCTADAINTLCENILKTFLDTSKAVLGCSRKERKSGSKNHLTTY